jgi:hypothetical protein
MAEKKRHDWSVPPLSREERERWILRFVEPPAKHPNRVGVWCYYCGWASLVPCIGLVLGPLALVFGISGLFEAMMSPSRPGLRHVVIGMSIGAFSTALNIATFLLIAPLIDG